MWESQHYCNAGHSETTTHRDILAGFQLSRLGKSIFLQLPELSSGWQKRAEVFAGVHRFDKGAHSQPITNKLDLAMLMYILPWNRRWLTPQPHGSCPWLLITGKPTKHVSPWVQALGISYWHQQSPHIPFGSLTNMHEANLTASLCVSVSEEVFQSMCIFLLKGEKRLSRITK